jgi:hypothetical protein
VLDETSTVIPYVAAVVKGCCNRGHESATNLATPERRSTAGSLRYEPGEGAQRPSVAELACSTEVACNMGII